MTTRFTLPPAVAFTAMTAAFAAFFIAAGAPTPLLPIYEASWRFPASMVTLAFGVYAIALLLTLLVVGSLSDHVGRRPLLIAALALELVSMLAFLVAPSIGWIIAARVLQGIATAAATSAFSAAVLELAPGKRKHLAGVVTGLAPAAGIGIGALFAGVVAQFSSSAAVTVWSILAAVMLAGLVLAVLTPETASRKPGAVESLRPYVSIPPAARPVFVATLPSLIAAWLVSALFLGLMPTILHLKFGIASPAVSGLAAFAEQGAGGAVALAFSRVKPQRLVLWGSFAIAVGSVLFLLSVTGGSLPLLWIGAVVGGAGLGGAFTGTIRSLVPRVETHERAGLFSAIYLVSYLTFGVPVIVAGLFLSRVGVTGISLIFGAVTLVAAGAGIVTQLRAGLRLPVAAAVAIGLVAVLGVAAPASSSQAAARCSLEPSPPAGYTEHKTGGINYVIGGHGPVLLLLHGYPESWYEWIDVLPALAEHYTVVAPDLPGAGDSDAPAAVSAYTKTAMAADVHGLMGKLGLDHHVRVVGHDIGTMVAYSYAAAYPDEVDKLVLSEAPLPDQSIYTFPALSSTGPGLWWFGLFNEPPALSEGLMSGKEEVWTTQSMPTLEVVKGALTPCDLAIAAHDLEKPGHLRATIDWFTALPQDVKDQATYPKLTMPVLAVGSSAVFGASVATQAGKYATDVTGLVVTDSGHWLYEEQPAEMTAALLNFLR